MPTVLPVGVGKLHQWGKADFPPVVTELHLFFANSMTRRQYEKQDRKENVKMANIVVTMATLFMAVCAGVRVL